ncbi:MAG: hypothetical protein CM1200mP10_26290 [Candidatus Neomarinimicrobiota bacterium]|nr:MAG: hypothetical protein CM1200mP10_26290 [Candidatus Neomarinimicrobiota bacterium]
MIPGLNGQEVTISGIVTTEFWGGGIVTCMCRIVKGWRVLSFIKMAAGIILTFHHHRGQLNFVAEGDSVTLTGTVKRILNLTQIKGCDGIHDSWTCSSNDTAYSS